MAFARTVHVLFRRFAPDGIGPRASRRAAIALAIGLVATAAATSACAQVQPGTTPTRSRVSGSEPLGPAQTSDAAASVMTMETYLDRLMMAESGGHQYARNLRSTALGPYQFIESTFLEVVRRHFAGETAGLGAQQVLALRTDLQFSRRAAEAYSRDNAGFLSGLGLPATFQSLRLAFLVGPAAAARLLRAPPQTPASRLLGPAVINANPFMAPLTAAGLIARAARDLAVPPTSPAGVAAEPGAQPGASKPGLAIPCNIGLASCRRWVALRQGRGARMAVRNSKR